MAESCSSASRKVWDGWAVTASDRRLRVLEKRRQVYIILVWPRSVCFRIPTSNSNQALHLRRDSGHLGFESHDNSQVESRWYVSTVQRGFPLTLNRKPKCGWGWRYSHRRGLRSHQDHKREVRDWNCTAPFLGNSYRTTLAWILNPSPNLPTNSLIARLLPAPLYPCIERAHPRETITEEQRLWFFHSITIIPPNPQHP